MLQGIAEGYIPRMVYAIGLGQLFLVVVSLLFDRDRELNCNRNLAMKTVAVLSAWSPTIIILLLGKQGSLKALALQVLIFLLFLWYCIKLQCLSLFSYFSHLQCKLPLPIKLFLNLCYISGSMNLFLLVKQSFFRFLDFHFWQRAVSCLVRMTMFTQLSQTS